MCKHEVLILSRYNGYVISFLLGTFDANMTQHTKTTWHVFKQITHSHNQLWRRFSDEMNQNLWDQGTHSSCILPDHWLII